MKPTKKSDNQNTFQSLIKKNKQFAKDYMENNALMQVISSPSMKNQQTRKRLLDCIQVFSNYFQKVVLLRSVLNDDQKFFNVTQIHLEEEFGHNHSLMRDRNHMQPAWDPILEATSSWFTWKMFMYDNEERTVLVHLVLETSANIFFQEAHKIMRKYGETDYFKIHSDADEKHEKMGTMLLKNLPNLKYKRLLEIQSQGWDMLNAACNRIANLTDSSVT